MKSLRIVLVALATIAPAMPGYGAPAKKADTVAPKQQEGTPLLDLSRWLNNRLRNLSGPPLQDGTGKTNGSGGHETSLPCLELDRTKCPIG